MSKQEYVENIIKALRGIEGGGDVEITPNTRFSDIEAVDSMSIIDFQMNLREAAYDMASGMSLDSLADRFGVGKYSLIRQFKKETGQAPIRYMIALRLQHAEQLLLLSSMSITEIAAVCGYSSPSFFAAEFKKHLGMTPRQFRQQGGK